MLNSRSTLPPEDSSRSRRLARSVRAGWAWAGALTIGVVTALAFSGPGTEVAGAATPFTNSVYSGELTTTHAPFFFAVSRNGRTITQLLTAWHGTCQSASSQPLPTQLQARQNFKPSMSSISVSRSGTFQTTQTEPPAHGATARVTISGSFKSPSVATGTIEDREVISQNGSPVATCDSGPLAFTANGIAGFVGVSSQSGPVDVNFTTNIKQVKVFRISWLVPRCSSGAGRSGDSYDTDIAVRAGSFKDAGQVTGPEAGGGSQVEALSVSGQFVNGHKVKGTFRDTVTIKNPDGSVQDTCDTGTVNWSASSQPPK